MCITLQKSNHPTMTSSKTSFLLFSLIFLATTFFSNCKKDKQLQEIAQIIQEWQGKEVLFPENITFAIHGRDTVAYDISQDTYKILVYIDSVGCTSCRLHLDRWRELIYEIDALSNGSVPVLFFLHAKNPREMFHLLRRDEINIPVVFDLQDELNKLNRFPANQNFQTFLLGKNNRVVFIGNPVNNLAIRDMYLSEITSGTYQAPARSASNTEIEIGETMINLGTFTQGEAKTVTVPIKNIGNAPFIIFDARVSCGCTKVDYDRQSIAPNATTEINITYNADETGRFDRTVSVFGNMSDSPLIIRLRGVVE
jgi:hypothetical protein